MNLTPCEQHRYAVALSCYVATVSQRSRSNFARLAGKRAFRFGFAALSAPPPCGVAQMANPFFSAKKKKTEHPKGVPSIKQVLPAENIVGRWLAAAENKRYMQRKRREINPRPTTKGVRTICTYSFSHALPARYSVLHLLGVLSGGNEPPFAQGSLWFVRPESLSAFPYKHCFCVHKSEAPHEAGQNIIRTIVVRFLLVLHR